MVLPVRIRRGAPTTVLVATGSIRGPRTGPAVRRAGPGTSVTGPGAVGCTGSSDAVR